VKASIVIKSSIATFVFRTGLVAWKLRRVNNSNFTILMYHRVIPHHEAREGVQPGMYVEPATFEGHVLFLKKHFSIVPIYELPLDHKKIPSALNPKPFCVLTFDDGWHDFYTYAFPILRSYRVPATVFLPTDLIGTEDWFWTDRLAFLFHQRKYVREFKKSRRESRNSLVNRIINLRGSFESCKETAIEFLKSYPNEEIEKTLIELSAIWNLSPNPPGRAFLSWEEAREMGGSGLISFGSHTTSHRILTTLNEGEILDELVKSRERLVAEQVVDASFVPFSYPNGNYNARIAELVRDAGYSLAVTTEKGWNDRSDPYALRRVAVHQDMTSTRAMLGCRILGIF